MNDLTSESGLNSSVPAFVLMVQYLLNQQLNVTDNRCSKHEEEILKLHQERLEFERERERLETTFITIHKKYVAMERKLQAIEIKTKIKELQEQGRILNNNICNCTGIKRSSKLQSTETDSYHSTSLEKLQKFFEIFFKKENGECNKNRALHVASRMDIETVAEALVKAGTDVNTEDPFSWERTPLHWAAVLNHMEIARILLDGGADVECRETGVYSMSTPLHEAAKHGHLNMCALLLDAHADENSRDKDGSTALHIAARNGHLQVVKYLVGRGSTIMAQDKWGQTPKDRARKYKHDEVADWLSEAQYKSRYKVRMDSN